MSGIANGSSSDEEESEPDQEEEEEGSNELEDWVQHINRTTGVAEVCLKSARLEDWVLGQRRGKLRWAGHVARRWDGRWSNKILFRSDLGGNRRVGQGDSIRAFLSASTRFMGAQCITLAQNRQE